MFEFLKRKKKQAIKDLNSPLLIEFLDINNGDVLASGETCSNKEPVRMHVIKNGTTGCIRYSMPVIGGSTYANTDVQKVEKGCYIDAIPTGGCFVYFS